MPLLTRKQAILVKQEAVYGTDIVPTGSANYHQVTNLSVTPLQAQTVERNLIRPYLGNYETLLYSKSVQVTFDIEISGSGAVATEVKYGDLLKACGFASTATGNPVTSYTYTPISGSFTSVTIYAYVDGAIHRITGARGTVDLNFTVGQIPMFSFTMTGKYNTPTDAALPAVTSSAQAAPLVVNNANTPVFDFFGQSQNVLKMQSLTLQLGADVQVRDLVGTNYIQYLDRRTTGTTVFECILPETFNFFTKTVGDITGTYSQTTTTVTVTARGHGLTTNDVVYVVIDSGGAVSGSYTVTVTDANVFTYTAPSSASNSGTVVLPRATTGGELSFQHGVAAGNRIKIQKVSSHATHVDLTDGPTLSDDNGIVMLNCNFALVPSAAGNDEFQIVFD